MTREGYPVKTFIATVTVITIGVTGILLWGAVHAQRMDVSSSQIFIHGTPVCVFRHAGEIVASVGLCGSPGGESRAFENGGGFHGGAPSPLGPRLGLPPGHPPIDHPPIDSSPDLEEVRRILI
jgi:hypothetical protein